VRNARKPRDACDRSSGLARISNSLRAGAWTDILAVNARLLADSGGPCECSAATADDFACVFYDTEYAVCLENFRRQLVTVTALASFIACFLMGVGANLPFALAPGMGLNAYFTYDVVGFRGTGRIKWKIAMAAIFLEGIVFVVLTLTGLRIKFAKAIPSCIKYAMTGGIGFFLAHLGLQVRSLFPCNLQRPPRLAVLSSLSRPPPLPNTSS
jgi:AGZA family xanthine/uracil permease-like MFS transporter